MDKKKKIKKNEVSDEIACLKCKAKFDIWLVNSNFPMDVEDKVRKRFYNYCGICKEYEKYSDVEKDKKTKKGRFKEA